jgi:Zn-dependent protease/CBS domain-containing protein
MAMDLARAHIHGHGERDAAPRSWQPMSGGGFGLGSIAAVRIEVDWSLLIVFTLVLVNLGAGLFPQWHPEWAPMLIWGVAFCAALLFFASVLLHELSHALVARRNGIAVPRITLFLFGGVAHMTGEPPAPKAEFWMAIVGPIVSIAIGMLALAAGSALAGTALEFVPTNPDELTLRNLMSGVGPVATLLLWLGPINLMLGVFNLLPGFPLDGGRVLRSIVWWSSGDLVKATRWASAAGRAFAWMLMALGVMNLFITGAPGQGLWLLLIGWFLNNAARTSFEQLVTQRALQDVPVTRVMWTQPRSVTPELTLDRFMQEYVLGGDQSAFPVEVDGALVGIVTFDDLRKFPHSEWTARTVREVLTPLEDLATLPVTAAADEALEELARRDVDQLPVLEGHALRGMVRRRDLVRFIVLQGEARGTR